MLRRTTMSSVSRNNQQSNGAEEVWVDDAWLDTVVVVGITLFILCLMRLSSVPTAKRGILDGMAGMTALILGYWLDDAYTYDDGPWLVAVSMAPGLVVGLWSAYTVEMTGLPGLVGAFNGLGGLAAALEVSSNIYKLTKWIQLAVRFSSCAFCV